MGFITKSLTKKRVAPMSAPLNGALAGTPWTTTGAIPVGALMRSAAFSLAIEGLETTSAAYKSVLTPTRQTFLWLESTDSRKWQLILGIPAGHQSMTVDWLIEVGLDTTNRAAIVTTSRYRTFDDVLVHADQHDALRADLLKAMSLGVQPDAGAEARVSALSLRGEQPFDRRPPDPVEVEFEITTSLEAAAIRDELRLLGHRVQETTADSVRWGLGLPADQDANEVTIEVGDKMLHGRARVAGASPASRRIAATDLRSFIARALFLIRSEDAGAAFRGPREWAP